MPSGTVTFLITDVQGSTRSFQRLGDEYPTLLNEHHQLVRRAIDAQGGLVVKDSGDGLLAAFADASAACMAAVDAQVALSGGPWSIDTRLRIRMGLHTGDAAPVAGDYVALAVHQTARIAAAGHGDQILVSETTAQMASEGLVSGVTARPIGRHWLRDFDAPAAIFQLCHPALPATFPRLRVPAAASPGLPAGRTSFVGREDELSRVRSLLADVHLVTITALGGAGKTRLALRIAADLHDRFDDGVWIVDLGALQPGTGVAAEVATTLGVVQAPGESHAHALLAHLQSRITLLVLDAAEVVREEARDLVQYLLSECHGLTVVVTSRVPLGVVGEVVWGLPSMTVPDAGTVDAGSILNSDSARLFVERAAMVRFGFAATSENAAAIARICRRLDGIPLAIELAAARLKVLTPEKLAERLEDSLGVLDAGGDRAAEERTLAATIDWSWRLLAADEKTVFRRLSVFVGGASLEAAEAVCAADDVLAESVLDVLSRLIDRSLVVYEEQNGEPRYRMLDAVRQYATVLLGDAGEADEVADRFIQWCEAFAACVADADERPDYNRWLARADDELDNVRAAFARAARTDNTRALTNLSARMSAYLPIRGRYAEALAWLQQAIASHRRAETINESLWFRAGSIETATGNLAVGEALLTELTERGGHAGGWRESALLSLGGIAMRRGDLPAAQDRFEEGLRLARSSSLRVNELRRAQRPRGHRLGHR